MAEASFGQGDIERSQAQATETLSRLTGALPSRKLGWLMLIMGAGLRQLLAWLLPFDRAARSANRRAGSGGRTRSS